jgi:uncharacterized membrane protein
LIATNVGMLLLRFLHIMCGAAWFGAAFLFVGFIGPSAAEVGPSAGPLLHVAVKKKKVAKVITWLGMVTVTVGWILWLRDVHLAGSLSAWLKSPFGLGLTIGGIVATVAFFLGAFGVGRNVERLVDLGDEVAASGGPPSPEQQQRMAHLGTELEKHGKVDLLLLLLAVTCMATASYW